MDTLRGSGFHHLLLDFLQNSLVNVCLQLKLFLVRYAAGYNEYQKAVFKNSDLPMQRRDLVGESLMRRCLVDQFVPLVVGQPADNRDVEERVAFCQGRSLLVGVFLGLEKGD